jgi:hypothetical protein
MSLIKNYISFEHVVTADFKIILKLFYKIENNFRKRIFYLPIVHKTIYDLTIINNYVSIFSSVAIYFCVLHFDEIFSLCYVFVLAADCRLLTAAAATALFIFSQKLSENANNNIQNPGRKYPMARHWKDHFKSLFVCIAAKTYLTNERTLSAVPSRILINSLRCDTTPV